MFTVNGTYTYEDKLLNTENNGLISRTFIANQDHIMKVYLQKWVHIMNVCIKLEKVYKELGPHNESFLKLGSLHLKSIENSV